MKRTEEKWMVWQNRIARFPNPMKFSIADTRTMSIKRFLEGKKLTWRQCKSKYGCKCIRTSITYEPVEK